MVARALSTVLCDRADTMCTTTDTPRRFTLLSLCVHNSVSDCTMSPRQHCVLPSGELWRWIRARCQDDLTTPSQNLSIKQLDLAFSVQHQPIQTGKVTSSLHTRTTLTAGISVQSITETSRLPRRRYQLSTLPGEEYTCTQSELPKFLVSIITCCSPPVFRLFPILIHVSSVCK